MNMGSMEFRSKVKEYTEKAIKDLEEARKITDTEEQCNKISFAVRIHKQNLEELKQGKPESISYYENYLPFNLDKYEKKVKELDDCLGEVAKKSNKIREQKQKEQCDKDYELKTSHCSYCRNKPPTNHYIYSEKNKVLKPRKRNAKPHKREYLFCSELHFEKWHKKNYFTCAECLNEKWDGKYKKNKKDNQKFCSDNCFYTHYAETCDNCLEKCVVSYQGKATGFSQTYYSDPENKTGTLCSKCHQEQLKEEQEEKQKDREWEESSKRLDKHMDDLVDSMVEAVAKDKEEVDNQDNTADDSSDNGNSNIDNNPISNNTHIRERERERERASPI